MHLSRRKCLKIVIIAATLVFVIISGAAFFKSKNTSSIKQPQYFLGNTSGNIINNGLIAYQKGYIYFSNTSDKNKLYRMKEDGSDRKKLSDDSCSFINVIEEWVYYRNADDGGKIYKIKTDGTIRTCLNDDDSNFITAAGDFIYYCNSSNGNQITRIKNDGSGKKIICKDSAEFLNISNGWVYYSNASENYSLYKVTMDGEKRTLISKDMCYFLNVSGDWVYYSNYSKEFKLCKIKINGRGKTVIDSTASHSINVFGDWIYYTSINNEYGESGLYKIKTDGTCKENICNEFCEGINLSDNWVFFINAFDKKMLYKVKPDGTMKQNNDGVTVVRSIYDLNNALLGNIPYEIKEDKLTKAFEKAKEIVKELIKPEMTDLEKELILHNYVVTHSEYDIDNYEKDKITVDAGSAYGILVKGIGVCSGYAESLQLLLNLSNVECRWVVGMAGQPGNTGLHAWNIVKIDGEYYHLDATWDDPVPDMGNHLTLQYFNLPDDVIEVNHTWEKSNYNACTSKKFSYFRDMAFPVYQDGWIYYSSLSDENGLYKIRIDGSKKERLSNDDSLYILIDGKNLYFSNYSNGGYLYRMNIYGKDKKQLTSEYSEAISIENGILKYKTKKGDIKSLSIR